ncbi:MAG: cytidylyltransferase domain-containing protein [Lachnotalea sp.]
MYNHKTFLAIIPARSGSKGIRDKNIKNLNGKPLMAYTIEACKKSNIFDEIIVSTDTLEYANIAQSYGANVPFLRPKCFATDQAATCDVILHVLKEMQKQGELFDYFMLLQPTSPLRNEQHIKESLNVLFDTNADSVISICKVEHPMNLNVKIEENGRINVLFPANIQARRQEVSQEYRINGAMYLSSTEFFLSHASFYGGRTFSLIMSPYHSIDIDDEFQFKLAEYVMKEYDS